jgi:pimeloyl-ACP methyl ester carboxylesterase
MRFWQTRLGSVLGLALLVWSLAVALSSYRVWRVTRPPRQVEQVIDFAVIGTSVQPVEFRAVDGPRLKGIVLEGGSSRPSIVLCHDLGSSQSEMMPLALRLQSAGFTTLVFDFRGHGSSEGRASTLGIDEKRDVLGAVDFLGGRERLNARRVGVYGVGMGAHAAVLACADRPSIRVLVLDGLYPEPGFTLTRRVFAGWEPGERYLDFLPRGVFAVLNQKSLSEHSASEVMPGLVGRDVLLLAPERDARLTLEMTRMVRSIPEQRDVDGNLLVLPATQSEGLYGENVTLHHEKVIAFFDSRL